MNTDEQGNVLSDATIAAAEIHGEAIEAFTIYRGDPVGMRLSRREASHVAGLGMLFGKNIKNQTQERRSTDRTISPGIGASG